MTRGVRVRTNFTSPFVVRRLFHHPGLHIHFALPTLLVNPFIQSRPRIPALYLFEHPIGRSITYGGRSYDAGQMRATSVREIVHIVVLHNVYIRGAGCHLYPQSRS
jgi:hypothetical protein